MLLAELREVRLVGKVGTTCAIEGLKVVSFNPKKIPRLLEVIKV